MVTYLKLGGSLITDKRRYETARPVVITRAGWAGVQRYATSWTGDNQSTWESLRLTVPEVIGLGLSGLGFTGPDVHEGMASIREKRRPTFKD